MKESSDFQQRQLQPSAPVQVSAPSSAPPLTKLLLGLGLVAATLLIFCRCLDHPFSNYDDPAYVFDNPHVQAGLTRESVAWAFKTFHFANWHPLTWLSLQLDATLYGGAKAEGFHLTNVLLHTANALLLYLILCGFTGRVWPSAVVAALFALHPQHVESVAWISERKGLVSTLFFLLALAAYGAYVSRPSARRYVLVAAALALGLMAKAMVVTLPCVLLLLDYWPLGRWQRGKEAARSSDAPQRLSFGRLVLEKTPLFVLVLLGSVMGFLGQHRGQAVASLEQFPLGERLGNALLAYVGYIGKMLWPMHLAVYYHHTRSAISSLSVIVAGSFLLGFTFLVFQLRRSRPYLIVGWLWYLGTLVPVIGLVQINEQAMADRYSYLPTIGLFLILVWGATDALRTWGLPLPAVFAGAAAVLAFCAGRSWIQLGYWSSDLALWQHAAAITRENATTCTNLGNALYSLGRRPQALKEYQKAVRLNPHYVPAHYHLGLVLLDLNRPDEAVAELLEVHPKDPEYRQARGKLGQFCYREGLLDLARRQFEEVVALEPDSAAARMDLGLVLRDLERLEEARTELQRSVQLDPGNVQANAALAQTLLDLGQYEEAEACVGRTLSLLPADHSLRGALEQQRQSSRRMQALERRLPTSLANKAWPTTSGEQLAVAELCRKPRWRRYAAATRLYAAAFADPTLAEPVRRQHRYAAVVSAALAGTGHDATPLDTAQMRHWRNQAQEWIKADLTHAQPDEARRRLRRWQRDSALDDLREPTKLTQWSAVERETWQKLWRELESRLAQDRSRTHAVKRLLREANEV